MNNTVKDLRKLEVWFITGSQHLYGEETLKQVAEHAREIARHLDGDGSIPVSVVYKPIVKTPEEIVHVCREANQATNCIGIICWMHTFSPAKMWIGGLKILSRPLLHLHTQFNRDIPWATIDMDFMNLNQSAHGDREFGHIITRMRIPRKVVVGHWKSVDVISRIATWLRAAAGWHDWQGARFARFGDNMRQVSVTEGDKVSAEMAFGYAVNGFGIGDLVAIIKQVEDVRITELVQEYDDTYDLSAPLRKGGDLHASLREAARIELGMSRFLTTGGFSGFTDTFEDLHGLAQLPGIPSQRLMERGFGFGAEGDWKTAALVRAMKVMAAGLPGGNSFMEDYTYHFDPENQLVLGAHMLEICPSIANGKPTCEIHPLGIGGKADPVRLVFNAGAGSALNASMIDLGNRFRLIVNEVEAVVPPHPLPKLPVARALWKPLPDMATGCAAWIYAGGAHHTCYSQNLSTECLQDFAEMAGVECVLIDRRTDLYTFRNQLRLGEIVYR
jgi:L-arabinose isomerase